MTTCHESAPDGGARQVARTIECGGTHRRSGLERLPGEAAEQHLGGMASHLVGVEGDDRDRTAQRRGQLEVVEADEADFRPVGKRLGGADRGAVVGGEEGGRRVRARRATRRPRRECRAGSCRPKRMIRSSTLTRAARSAAQYPAYRSRAVYTSGVTSLSRPIRRCPPASRCSTASRAPCSSSSSTASAAKSHRWPVEEDHRHPVVDLSLEELVVVPRAGDQQPVDAALDETVDDLALAAWIVVGADGDQQVTLGQGRVLDDTG